MAARWKLRPLEPILCSASNDEEKRPGETLVESTPNKIHFMTVIIDSMIEQLNLDITAERRRLAFILKIIWYSDYPISPSAKAMNMATVKPIHQAPHHLGSEVVRWSSPWERKALIAAGLSASTNVSKKWPPKRYPGNDRCRPVNLWICSLSQYIFGTIHWYCFEDTKLQFSQIYVTSGWADSTDSVEYANINGWLLRVDAFMEEWQTDGVKDAATKSVESYNRFRHSKRKVFKVRE